MRSTRRTVVAIGVIAAVLGLAAGPVTGSGAGPAQGPPLETVMQKKLVYAQKILEAVVTSDWTGLDANSLALEELTNDPGWVAMKYPEYARHSTAFVRAVRALRTAAARRDPEETPNAYFAVTLSCVECHRYVARARMAN